VRKPNIFNLIFVFLLLLIGGLSYFIFFYNSNLFKKVQFVCPVSKALCKRGQVVRMGDKYFGIGYKLDVGEPIKAVIDAEGIIGMTSLKIDSNVGNYYSILQTADNGYSVKYIVTRTLSPYGKKYYKAGETITTADLNTIGSLDMNLLVVVYQDDKRVEFQPKNFR